MKEDGGTAISIVVVVEGVVDGGRVGCGGKGSKRNESIKEAIRCFTVVNSVSMTTESIPNIDSTLADGRLRIVPIQQSHLQLIYTTF